MHRPRLPIPILLTALIWASPSHPHPQPQSRPSGPSAKPPLTWNSVEFAIVRYNENAPNTWNIYHAGKKGVFLVRIWKRYLLVKVDDQEAYDIDPQTIKVHGNSAEWSYADMPEKPIETPDWKARDVGPVTRIRFRLGKNGHFLELQIPLGPNGRPIY